MKLVLLRRIGLLAALLVASWPLTAAATHIVEFEVGSDAAGTMTLSDAQLSCTSSGPGTYECSASNIVHGSGMWELDSATLQLDTDPSVIAITAVTNTSASVQNFTVSVLLPISATFGPPVAIQGSISGSLTESNGSGGAMLNNVNANTPLYQAFIDGNVVRTLNDNLPVSVSLNFDSTTIGPDRFGIPTPEVLNATAASNIAITLRFALSPGDSASFTSVFNVVPEPTTAVLMGLGLLGIVGASRRAGKR